MALLRAKEIREMDSKERRSQLKDLRDELMHERGVAAMGGAPPSPGKIRALRRNISRLLTVLAEQEGSIGVKETVMETTEEERV
ncbi:MAG: 50S ribosomal protein L29 [Thermoplasmata archaeon]